jgi:FemAB-related protein (PEP-CTERM system-associated)
MKECVTDGPRSMQIEIVQGQNVACDKFVQQHADGKLCFLTRWSSMVAASLGHRALYLAASDGNRVSGVLPLTLVKSRLFGARMISQAFSNYGGVLAVDSQTTQGLVNKAVELATKHHCRQLELRSLEPAPGDLVTRTDKVCMYLHLSSDPNDMWSRLRSEIRNRVRKTEKAHLKVQFGDGKMLNAFYRVWTARMHELGTPAYPRSLFRRILEVFPEHAAIGLVRLGERIIGAGFFCCFNGLAQCRWAATDTAFNALAPNVLLYWAAIQHYCRQGASVFDFGRSTYGSTQYEFKRRWGAEVVHLHYQYWTPSGTALSLIRPDEPKYRLRVAVWKKTPLWMTRIAGPVIGRSLA